MDITNTYGPYKIWNGFASWHGKEQVYLRSGKLFYIPFPLSEMALHGALELAHMCILAWIPRLVVATCIDFLLNLLTSLRIESFILLPTLLIRRTQPYFHNHGNLMFIWVSQSMAPNLGWIYIAAIFTSIVWSKTLQFPSCLNLNQSFPFLESIKYIRFILNTINPSFSSCIINKSNIISRATERWYLSRSPYVCMHKL